MHTTLRERYERKDRIKRIWRGTMQACGYTLAGVSISVIIYLFLLDMFADTLTVLVSTVVSR